MADSLSFAASVSEWAQKELGAAEAIFQTAAQAVASEVTTPVAEGGSMPVISGNLRRSLMASTAEMPSIKPEQKEFTDSGIELVIAGAEIGSTVFLGFQAGYSARVNFGFVGTDSLGRVYNQTGRAFVDKVAQRWPEIVKEAETAVRSRFEAGQS